MGLYEGSLLTDDHPRGRVSLEGITSTPLFYTLDFRLEKSFSLWRLQFTPFVYVQNLLNRKNVIDLYPRTGKADYDGYKELRVFQNILERYDGAPDRLYELINLQHRQHFTSLQGGDLFARPREIRFGVRVGF